MKNRMLKNVVLMAIVWGCLNLLHAGIIETYSTALSGTGIKKYTNPGAPGTTEVADPKFFNGSYPASVEYGSPVLLCRFRFEDQNLAYVPTAIAYKIDYNLELYNAYTNLSPVYTYSAANGNEQSLIVYVTPDGIYTDKSFNRYTDALPTTGAIDIIGKAKMYITRVSQSVDYTITGTPTWTEINTGLSNDYFVDMSLSTERYFTLSYGSAAPTVSHTTSNLVSCGTSGSKATDGYLNLYYNYNNAEEYEIEWLFADVGSDDTYASTAIDWRNATRIVVKHQTGTNSYKIPLAYSQGIIVYRARFVGYDVETISSVVSLTRKVSNWSYSPTNPFADMTGNAPSANRINYCGLEAGMNWTYQAAFTENGNKGYGISFYDGAMNPRQSASYMIHDSLVILDEDMYDHVGRQTVNIMPGVQGSTGLKFYGANINNGFNKTNFDTDNKLATSGTGPDPLTGGVTNTYYSTANADPFVPDAQGYAYSQTRMMNDGTGRIHSQGGVGNQFKIAGVTGSHKSRFLYATPGSQQELDRMFGNEVGFLNKYFKNATIDENGQGYVSYLDQEGRVIATAITGPTPGNLVQLPEANTTTISNVSLLDNNTLSQDGNEYTSSKTVMVLTSQYLVFNYSLSRISSCNDCVADAFDNPELVGLDENECFQCMYDLYITVTDEDGNSLPILNSSNVPITFPILHTSAQNISGFKTNIVEPGVYTITKTLRLNHTDKDALLENLRGQLIAEKDAFIDNPENPLPHCIPFEIGDTGCDDCNTLCEKSRSIIRKDSYGNNVTVYFDENGDTYVAADYPGNNGLDEINATIVDALQAQITACKQGCDLVNELPDLNECDMKMALLKQDMSPGGQYFDNLPQRFLEDNTENPAYHTGTPTLQNKWVETYIGSAGLSDIITAINASAQPCSTCTTWDDIRTNWHDEWADILVVYHPEYCMHQYFCGYDDGLKTGMKYNISEYMESMMEKTTDAGAVTVGMLDPLNTNLSYPSEVPTNMEWPASPTGTCTTYVSCPEYYMDPYFASTGPGAASITTLENHLLNYIPSFLLDDGITYYSMSIWDVITDPQNIKAETLGTSNYPDWLINFMISLHGNGTTIPCGLLIDPAYTGTCTNTQISRFQFFRSYYLFRRQQVIQENFSTWARPNCHTDESAISTPHYSPVSVDYITGTGSCPACTAACSQCFYSQFDSDEDGLTDVAMANPSYNGLDAYFVRYPYLNVLNANLTNVSVPATELDACENSCSIYANQWLNQLTAQFAGCDGVTPFPVSIRNKLKEYFIEACQDACAIDVDMINDPTITFPATPAMATTTNYYGTVSYNSLSLPQVLNNIVTAFDGSSDGATYSDCPKIMQPDLYTGVVASVTDTISQYTSCACNKLGEFIASNASLVSSPVSPYSPFDFSGGGFEDFDINTTFLTELNAFIGGGSSYTATDVYNWAYTCKNKTPNTLPATLFPQAMVTAFRCDPPMTQPSTPDCAEQNLITAIAAASAGFESLLDQMIAQIKQDYKTDCFANMTSRETFTYTYQMGEYAYTLYYYDQAGNLIKTVPPDGFTPITNTTTLNNLHQFRKLHHTQANYTTVVDGTYGSFQWPQHKKATNYKYNSFNQVIEQTTPDNGLSTYYYDALGRLVASQNSVQILNNLYSYTLFDGMGRITEVGQVKKVAGFGSSYSGTPYTTMDELAKAPYDAGYGYVPFVNWLGKTNNTKSELTRTFYDTQQSFVLDPSNPTGPALVIQTNLINRVASTAYYQRYPYVWSGGPDSIPDWQYYDNAIHYSYDAHGNVKLQVQDIPALNDVSHRFFRTEYEYELISGNVTKVSYQKGYADEFYHKYRYDTDNRLLEATTSRDGVIWEKEARYFYYLHGPVKRVETGDKQVQGTDYAYTLQGWLKGVNAGDLNRYLDMGDDGKSGSSNPHRSFAMDALGLVMGYYENDYLAAGRTATSTFIPFEQSNVWSGYMAGNLPGTSSPKGLFNGNISYTTYALMDQAQATALVRTEAYKYDQLGRLVQGVSGLSNAVGINTTITAPYAYNITNNGPSANSLKNTYSYYLNGDIKNLKRYNYAGTLMDDMNYNYDYANVGNSYTPTYNLSSTSKLNCVKDAAGTSVSTVDIDDQSSATNYTYDNLGNLITDASNALNMTWSVYGKVRKVQRQITGTNYSILNYHYNPMGQRMVKVNNSNCTNPTTCPETTKVHTIYALDASGNTMAIYEVKYNSTSTKYELIQKEIQIYGASRLGVTYPDKVLKSVSAGATFLGYNNSINKVYPNTVAAYKPQAAYTIPANTASSVPKMSRELGRKEYELSNHLGNVMSTIRDRKLGYRLPGNSTNTVDFYLPDVKNAGDYYPFGMPIAERTWPASGQEVQSQNSITKTWVAGTNTTLASPNTCTNNTSFNALALGAITTAEGWTTITSATLSIVASTSPFDCTTGRNLQVSSPADADGIKQTFTGLTVGATYVLELNVKKGTGCTAMAVTAVGTGDINYTTADVAAVGTKLICTFTATATSMQINVRGIGTGVTRIFGIDNWILYKQVVTSTAVNVNINQYRYGYGSQEKDNEIYGNGNAYTAEFWEYDPRLGRRWNTDPVVDPSQSPYCTFNNNPIFYSDISGASPDGNGDKDGNGDMYDDPESSNGRGYNKYGDDPNKYTFFGAFWRSSRDKLVNMGNDVLAFGNYVKSGKVWGDVKNWYRNEYWQYLIPGWGSYKMARNVVIPVFTSPIKIYGEVWYRGYQTTNAILQGNWGRGGYIYGGTVTGQTVDAGLAYASIGVGTLVKPMAGSLLRFGSKQLSKALGGIELDVISLGGKDINRAAGYISRYKNLAKGYTDIVLHGSEFRQLSVGEFSALLDSRGVKGNIRLWICKAGVNPKVVQELSNLRGVNIQANPHIITVTEGHYWFNGPQSSFSVITPK
jgi:YD repeat-containing protein